MVDYCFQRSPTLGVAESRTDQATPNDAAAVPVVFVQKPKAEGKS
jgi:hypothetical protein